MADDEDADDEGADDIVPTSKLPEHPAKTPIAGNDAMATHRVIDCTTTSAPLNL
ncbi:hypothetical protein [Mycolicibacterium lutetiense]|uniref:Uncharacterized protein n=1 Tax=Mycolicibacterium lutetiense TaxID=1641992 RepID=A0ABS5A118_9MYCO|nr:hypothetical protein [Mycolicibacterium lutetiense]MBP2455101.1 hypothetical protein [Mycolicibacterium lutetiense]